MNIQPATLTDVPQIVSLSMQARDYHNKILGNYFNTLDTNFEHRFLSKAVEDNNQMVFVARKDEAIIGFVLAVCAEKRWLTEPQTCSIENICVDEPFRSHGIGRALIDAVRSECAARGVQQLSLGVFCANTNAIPFYEACGFTPLSIKMNMKI